MDHKMDEDKPENPSTGDEEAGASECQMANPTDEDFDSSKHEIILKENQLLKQELDEAKSTLAVAEYIKESMIQLERQNKSMNEELATMQQLLNEAHDQASQTRTSYEHQLAKTKAVVNQLENENHDLRIHLKLSGGGSAGDSDNSSVLDKDTILGSAAAITDVTKSFARRMKSNLLPSVGLTQDRNTSAVPTSPLHPAASSPALGAQAHNLEDGMKKAYEDAEMMKSIIVPLEEQIGALKDKLREADSLLIQHEQKQMEDILGVEALAQWLQGKPFDVAMKEILEKSESPELATGKEMAQNDVYISLMSVRFSLLNSELASVKKEAKEVMELLDKERNTVKKLKQEAVATSSEIVRNQREHLADITRLQSVLSEEQKAELTKPQTPTTTANNSACDSVDISPGNSMSAESSPSRQDSQFSDDSGSVNLARIVSSMEWEEMQRELNKVRSLLGVGAGDSMIGSEQYRALQTELIEVKKQKAQLSKTIDRLKDELKEEATYRRQVEQEWNGKAEKHKVETDDMAMKFASVEESLNQITISYQSLYETTSMDLKKLTQDREKIVRELQRLQEENDVLVGKHSVKSIEMQNEVINLPEKMDDMQLLLLTFREDLITAKIAKERAEEKLQTDVNFLKNQIASEAMEKKTMHDKLTMEMQRMREKIHHLQSCKRQLEAEQKLRHEMETKEEKHKQSHATLQHEMEAHLAEKIQMENQIQDLKSKTSILQKELDNSVAVQTDFVRLSQSLQVELEKIRQSEKEVRWQHEDDVTDCQNCKLSLTTKRKHHCRHCGRIFCSQCVAKNVPSGPRQRPTKVCDVCHTLLVQNSAPYFSTEVPHA